MVAYDSQFLHCTLQNCVFFAISTDFLFNSIHDEWTRHHVAAFLWTMSMLMTHHLCSSWELVLTQCIHKSSKSKPQTLNQHKANKITYGEISWYPRPLNIPTGLRMNKWNKWVCRYRSSKLIQIEHACEEKCQDSRHNQAHRQETQALAHFSGCTHVGEKHKCVGC